MSATRISGSLLAGLHETRASWGWFLALGLLLIGLGVVCIIGDITATLATVLAFGWILIIAGVVALVHAFRVHSWSGFLLNLATALLRGFTGYFMIRYPLTGAIALTIVLAFFFCVSGIFRIVGSSALRYPRWGWSVLSGAVSVILGVLLLSQLPLSSLWFIGFAVGLDLILEGISLVTFATALHRTPERVILDQAA